jgi:hypothetical protein
LSGVEGKVDSVELVQGADQGIAWIFEKRAGAVGRQGVGFEGLGQGMEIRDVGGKCGMLNAECGIRRRGIMGIMGRIGRMGSRGSGGRVRG